MAALVAAAARHRRTQTSGTLDRTSTLLPEADIFDRTASISGSPEAKDRINLATPERSRVWKIYLKKAEDKDKELSEDWDRVIDVILVFGALFSAIATGFVLESSKNLQRDQGEATVEAVQNLTKLVNSSVSLFNASIARPPSGILARLAPESDDGFKPPITAFVVNVLWFSSLCISIGVSLLAMLAKRWCQEFRLRRSGTAYRQTIERQKSWEAIKQWKMQFVIEEFLPMEMHIALLLFIVGLVVYLASIDEATMIFMMVVLGAALTAYTVLTLLPIWFPSCPVVTPFAPMTLRIYNYILGSPSELYDSIGKMREGLRSSASISEPSERPLTEQDPLLNNPTCSCPKGITKFRPIKRITALLNSPRCADGVLRSCQHQLRLRGQTSPLLASEDNRFAFRALLWLLKATEEPNDIKAVLSHIVSFPGVILGSSASSSQLHKMATLIFNHIHRFEGDSAEQLELTDFYALCEKFTYLATRPWLHQPTEHGSCLQALEKLRDDHFEIATELMSQNEFDVCMLKVQEHPPKPIDPTPWMEAMAARTVLRCSPEMSLTICTALGKSILIDNAPPLRAKQNHVHSTLWWIFLNCVINCTNESWPCGVCCEPDGKGKAEDTPRSSMSMPNDNPRAINVMTNSLLTLSLFLNDSKTRLSNRPWLAVVGISGMLYAFARVPAYANGIEDSSSNDQYFTQLIDTLRSALPTPWPASATSDDFTGKIPVYDVTRQGTYLYKFDALQYAIDALHCASNSSFFRERGFSDDLRNLLGDFRRSKDNAVKPEGANEAHGETHIGTA